MTSLFKYIIWGIGITLLLFSPIHAQLGERITHASLEPLETSHIAAGESIFIALRLEPKAKWHTYWQNPGDSGIPTQITWKDLPGGFTAGPLHWPKPERIPYEFLVNYGYSGEHYIFIPITASGSVTPGEYTLSAKAEWLVCKDICIPESEDISINLTVVSEPKTTDAFENNTAIAHAYDTLPKPLPDHVTAIIQETPKHITIELPWENDINKVSFFPIDNGIIDNLEPITWHHEDNILRISASKGTAQLSDTFTATLWIEEDTASSYYQFTSYTKDALPIKTGANQAPPTSVDENIQTNMAQNITFLIALLLAFMGGIILNAMPCVLPILSLKTLSITKMSSLNRGAVIRDAVSYTAGTLASFAAIAMVLISLQSAGQAIGWGFQLQSPVFVASMIYVLFAVGLNLSGMYHISSRLSGAGNNLTHNNSTSGSFFTGMLAVLVATPCTAPFMAPALGFALTQPPAETLLIFLMLGLGLASPYLLISLLPALHRLLPKPGPWMEKFKQCMAFPIYLTVVWLAWVLMMQVEALAMLFVMGTIVIITFSIWLYNSSYSRLWHMIAIGMSVAAITYGLNELGEHKIERETARSQIEAIKKADAAGKAMLVDVTADWCITCKINEHVAIYDKAVQKHLEENAIELVVLDWTHKDDDITRYLAYFGRAGVPLYIYYPKGGVDPVILPQILTPSLLLEVLQ